MNELAKEIELEIDQNAQKILDTVSSKREQKNELETYGLQFGINLNKKNVFDDMVIQLKEHVSSELFEKDENGNYILQQTAFDDVADEETQKHKEHELTANTSIVDCTSDSIESDDTLKISKSHLDQFGYRIFTEKRGEYYFADLHERFVSAYLQFKDSNKDIDAFVYEPEQRITLSSNDIDLIYMFIRVTNELTKTHRVKIRGSRNGNIIEA